MKTLNRRSLIGAALSAIPAIAVVTTSAKAVCPSALDPVLVLAEEHARLTDLARRAGKAEDAEAQRLPSWADVDDGEILLKQARDVPEMRNFFGARRTVTLASIRRYNAGTEAIVSGFLDDPECFDDWKRRRAEGRARVRWFIAERRAVEAAQAEYERSIATSGSAWDRVCEIEERICATPATTKKGVEFKLNLAREYAGMDQDDLAAPFTASAARDMERIARAA